MTKGKTRLILFIAVVVLALGGLGLAITGGGSDQLDPPPVQASAAKTDLSSPPSSADAPSKVAASELSPVPEATADTTLDLDVAEVPLPYDAVSPTVREAKEVVEIDPDPNYEATLCNAGISTRGWLTHFSRHAVPYDTIISSGPPRDGIPPLDAPTFTTPSAAQQWLGASKPVNAFELNGDARACLLQILA